MISGFFWSGEPLRVLQLRQFIYVLLVCTLLASVYAAPTTGVSETPVSSSFELGSVSLSLSKIAAPVNHSLANIGEQLLQPPAVIPNAGNALSFADKTLPAVPASILMVFTGFMCVTFVKDRKVWLGAIAGLIYLSQAGITAVPELAHRVCSKKDLKERSSYKATYVYELDNSFRLRSDVEGFHYIGLLHCLEGIPEDIISSTTIRRKFSALRSVLQSVNESLCTYTSNMGHAKNIPSYAIVPETDRIEPLNSNLTVRVEQSVRFSPAFIFDNLARGPPALS